MTCISYIFCDASLYLCSVPHLSPVSPALSLEAAADTDCRRPHRSQWANGRSRAPRTWLRWTAMLLLSRSVVVGSVGRGMRCLIVELGLRDNYTKGFSLIIFHYDIHTFLWLGSHNDRLYNWTIGWWYSWCGWVWLNRGETVHPISRSLSRTLANWPLLTHLQPVKCLLSWPNLTSGTCCILIAWGAFSSSSSSFSSSSDFCLSLALRLQMSIVVDMSVLRLLFGGGGASWV